MKIEAINYPFCFTDNGKRIHIQDITGEPGTGKTLEEFNGKYKITGVSEAAESC